MPRKKNPQTTGENQQLTLKYVSLAQVQQWDRNPKKHDIGAIAQSIQKHGFKDPPKFEPTLNEGNGGIVEGNGRAEALAWMYAQEQPLPRGIALDAETGEWQIPILFGVDADSQRMAEAYALDHNNLVLAGGDFTAVDLMNMYDEPRYTEILTGLVTQGELPISVTGDDLDLLVQLQRDTMRQERMSQRPPTNGAGDDDDDEPMFPAGEMGGENGAAEPEKPGHFDAAKLPDAPQGKTRQSYLLYMSFFEHEHLQRAITILTLGTRNGNLLKPNERFAQMDGTAFLDQWEEALKDALRR